MPYAKDSYTGDSSTTDFVITFPYIEASHVVVKVDGITKTNPDDYTFTTDPQKIRFSTAPASGAIVLLVRSTSQTARLVDYQSGAVLSEEILDNDSLQAFYLTQEVWDIAEEGSIAVGTTTTSAAGGNASVVNAGTAANAILNFTIPRGPTGPTGLTGATGPAGTNGTNGADGADGADGVDGADGIFSTIASQAEAEAGTNNTKGMTPLRVKQAAFPAVSAAANGYIELGGGILMQWGYKADTGAAMQINYPISFSSAVYCIQFSMVSNGANYQNITVNTDYATSLDHFDITWDSAADGILWYAIGV